MLSDSSLRVRSTGVDSTRAAARSLAMVLAPGQVVLLNGDLGAGKTTFTQGLAAHLGIEDTVTSPTFSIMNVYECGPNAPIPTLVHMDAYRLGGPEGIEYLGLDELLREGAAALIEWGELVCEAFAEPASITISWVDEDSRDLSFTDFPEDQLSVLARTMANVGLKPCS